MLRGAGWAVAALMVVNSGAGAAHADSAALWQLVSGQCVADEVAHRDPAPCASVDLEGGWAVLKDAVGPRQYLLIPTAKVPGVESPELLADGAPNYFAAAWEARSFTEAAAGGALPRDWIALAVNSAVSRSQDQLHIHIDCLRADVHETLARHAADIGPDWAPFPALLAGHTYDAIAVDGDQLVVNPFRLRADALEDPELEMGIQTLVVVGAVRDSHPGFVILADRANGETGDFAGGEQLQDHGACPAAAGK
ncbi:MAG: CDP-diacylglycerol diphosphatase [Mycobacterium sp.]